jgi:glutathione peroxidase
MFKIKKIKLVLIIIMISFIKTTVKANYERLAYDFHFNDLDGSKMSLSEYKGKVIIVVNVASKCGFTNQYEDMQTVWKKYENEGMVMLGIPSNDFGSQEPGTSSEIKNFCEAKFGISFPMTEKVIVKGDNAHPFYQWALKNYGKSAVPKWNFHKIIIDRNGKIADTFTSITNPSSKKFIKAIEKLL